MFKKSFMALSAMLLSVGAFAGTAASAVAASAPAVAASAATVVASDPGFFMSLFGFLAGLLLTWPAFIALVFLGILFEHNGARGWAVFAALVLAAVSYFFFHVALMSIAIGAGAYLAFGVVWSFWRYKRHAANVVEQYKDADKREKDIAIARLHPKAMLSTITAWIVIWPFSMVENVVGDLITAIQTLVSKIFRGVYHRIYDAAVGQLTK